jgi:hypothetical protein
VVCCSRRPSNRLLKDGGELYFADVYADRRVPKSIRSDPVLYGECLGGALYWNDFVELAKSKGFLLDKHYELVAGEPLSVCGNTYDMLHQSRFRTHFAFHGDRSTHRGIFPGCGTSLPFSENGTASTGSC